MNIDRIITPIKISLKQGNPDKNIVFKAILDGVYEEYTEDNYQTRISTIVTWLLQNDETFQIHKKDSTFIVLMQKVMKSAVNDAVKGF